MSRRAKWTLGLTILVAVFGGLFALSAAKKSSRATEVKLESVAERNLVATVTASGRIEARLSTDARAGGDRPRAALAEAKSNLAKTRLVSPIDGRVVRLAVEEGE